MSVDATAVRPPTRRGAVLTAEELSSLGRPPEEARGLAARLYTDPEIFEAERERLFRPEWMPVFHQSTVPNVGDFRVFELAGESLLFVRGDDGRLRCFRNICRHRGAQPAQGRGNCSRFRCPYHAWTYDLRGKLIGAPEMAEVVREGIGLVELRVETYLGFVFVNQDGQAPPLASTLAPLEEELAPFLAVADQLELLYEIDYPGEWNWKLGFQNAIEGYHVVGTHLESAGDLVPGELTYTTVTDFRHYTDFRMPYAPPELTRELDQRDTTGGSLRIPNVPDWVDEELRFYPIWPTCILWFSPEAVFAGIMNPGGGPDSTTFTWTGAVLPETKRLPKFKDFEAEQIKFSNIIQGEDQLPCEAMWASVHSDGFIPGPYAQQQERSVYHFDQWYLARMSGAE